jgi:hypothetical protein
MQSSCTGENLSWDFFVNKCNEIKINRDPLHEADDFPTYLNTRCVLHKNKNGDLIYSDKLPKVKNPVSLKDEAWCRENIFVMQKITRNLFFDFDDLIHNIDVDLGRNFRHREGIDIRAGMRHAKDVLECFKQIPEMETYMCMILDRKSFEEHHKNVNWENFFPNRRCIVMFMTCSTSEMSDISAHMGINKTADFLEDSNKRGLSFYLHALGCKGVNMFYEHKKKYMIVSPAQMMRGIIVLGCAEFKIFGALFLYERNQIEKDATAKRMLKCLKKQTFSTATLDKLHEENDKTEEEMHSKLRNRIDDNYDKNLNVNAWLENVQKSNFTNINDDEFHTLINTLKRHIQTLELKMLEAKQKTTSLNIEKEEETLENKRNGIDKYGTDFTKHLFHVRDPGFKGEKKEKYDKLVEKSLKKYPTPLRVERDCNGNQQLIIEESSGNKIFIDKDDKSHGFFEKCGAFTSYSGLPYLMLDNMIVGKKFIDANDLSSTS